MVVGGLKSAINSIDFTTIDSSYVKRHGYSQIRCKVRSKYNLFDVRMVNRLQREVRHNACE